MSITRAQAESLIVGRVGSWLTKASLLTTVSGQPSDPTNPLSTPNGPNSDLNDPIRYALTVMGLAPVEPMAVADGDLARLDSLGVFALDEFLDRAELRTLKTVQGRFTKTSVTIDGIMVYTSDLLRQLVPMIAAKQKDVNESWGVAGGSLIAGVIDGDSAEVLNLNTDGWNWYERPY